MSVRPEIVGYLLASVMLWVAGTRVLRPGCGPSRLTWMSSRRLGRMLRFAYFVGFPYLAVVLGVVPANYVGLGGLSRVPVALVAGQWPSAGAILSSLVTTAGALSCAWLAYVVFRLFALPRGDAADAQPPSWLPSLAHVLYQQVHWAFYRGLIWALTGDPYTAALGGAAVVALEWLAATDWVRCLRCTHEIESLLLDASALVATSALFLVLPDLPFLLPAHWLLSVLCRTILRRGSREQTAQLGLGPVDSGQHGLPPQDCEGSEQGG